MLKNGTVLHQVKHAYATMPETVNKVLNQHSVGKKAFIQGWIKSVRKLKNHIFFNINDGSTREAIQVVAEMEAAQNIRTGASVSVLGTLSIAPNNQKELKAENVQLIGDCVITEGYPFAPRKVYPPEYVRQYLHFRPRTNRFSSLLRVRSNLLTEVTKYFNEVGFIHINTPIITSNDCEGGGEVFTAVPANKELIKQMGKPGEPTEKTYFNSEVYLTVSGQLHLEAVAHGLSKVYTMGPVFRAENSRSRLHLSEFYMLEAELAFINKISEILNVIENLLKTVTRRVLETSQDDINYLTNNKDFSWLDKPFVILTYDEAINILSSKLKMPDTDARSETEFSKEDELAVVSYCGNLPTFVINWPKQVKAFYMRECEDNPKKVSALDLLVPGVGEIVGGGLRENTYEKLQKNIPSDDKNFEWYLELRKFGGVPTGGFGLGFERYLQFLLDIENIKDAIPFPRWPHNCQL
ncbi:probable asparagine--tRNA ligase, mitochondrial [Agrilus planipennis]|uniref:asparagine--tRNA ligase n=1 Tax=Agrilus planipennis TaxID=224129 RepID=A0A7F5R6X7_AGRPL|nr:probable asparagine--tRNA ligase, mitochondrial [Agrilus planipennis]